VTDHFGCLTVGPYYKPKRVVGVFVRFSCAASADIYQECPTYRVRKTLKKKSCVEFGAAIERTVVARL
jgi:hypothetical protein